jgi:hypothetical protein
VSFFINKFSSNQGCGSGSASGFNDFLDPGANEENENEEK